MTGLLIGAAVWLAVASILAIVLGRVSTRADSEELGSMIDWDAAEIDEAVQPDR
ncbi:MAG: hypothetical protein WBQ44_08140 [Rhodococcus sp. (in: high G+C Gram-positive bacteria)]